MSEEVEEEQVRAHAMIGLVSHDRRVAFDSEEGKRLFESWYPSPHMQGSG